MASNELAARERILEGALLCVGRYGLAKTTIEDVARASGLSRASIYRYFPGGRDELFEDLVAWEMGRFFGRLAEHVADAPDFCALMEDGLAFARRALVGHEVLRTMVVLEPERLLPVLSTESSNVLPVIAAYLLPFLDREARAGRLIPGIDRAATADHLARMVLSLMTSPGEWDLEDPAVRRDLVRNELLAGILTPAALQVSTEKGDNLV
ncbi:MAG: transcriptional regulator, TetR family [Actinomycetia bacterium]|nr:transcriptional regulator, TetR family [Actinomycetes bacterium]